MSDEGISDADLANMRRWVTPEGRSPQNVDVIALIARLDAAERERNRLHSLAKANNDLARMVTTKLETLREAAQMIADDYQTSPKHHPNDILIPVASFHRLLAALTANHSAPVVEE